MTSEHAAVPAGWIHVSKLQQTIIVTMFILQGEILSRLSCFSDAFTPQYCVIILIIMRIFGRFAIHVLALHNVELAQAQRVVPLLSGVDQERMWSSGWL